MAELKVNCESCGAPTKVAGGAANFCKFCNAPLTFARRKAANRTRGKLTDVFKQSASPAAAPATSPRGAKPPLSAAATAAAERRNRRKALVVAAEQSVPCPARDCDTKVPSSALFCPTCGTAVVEGAEEQDFFCGMCGTQKSASKTPGEKCCGKCNPESVAPPAPRKFDRHSITIDPKSEKDVVMKATLQQGTLLNVAGGASEIKVRIRFLSF